MNNTIIYGHRGASKYAPENTFSSYVKAVEMGADGIEIDVHKSKDGYLIVCHDEKVDRTTNGKGFIKDLSLKEIKSLDAGSWFSDKYIGERIPLLEEVLEFVKKEKITRVILGEGPLGKTERDFSEWERIIDVIPEEVRLHMVAKEEVRPQRMIV